MSVGKKSRFRVAILFVAIAIVMVQQIQGASGTGAPPASTSSSSSSAPSASASTPAPPAEHSHSGSSAKAPSAAASNTSGSAPSASATEKHTTSAADQPESPCTKRLAFGDVQLHVNGKMVGKSDLQNHGHPFDGWQEEVVEGDNIRVGFTVAPGCGTTPVSLVSYQNVQPFYTPETASQQKLYDSASTTATEGEAMKFLEVTVPDCYFQVDFVHQKVAKTLQPGTYDTTLGAAAVGGTKACAAPATTTTTSTTTTAAPKVECPTALNKIITDYSVATKEKSSSSTAAETFSRLEGNISANTEVTVEFSIAEGCKERLSLASYEAESTSTDNESLAKQKLFDSQSKSFSEGTHTLTVDVPSCIFQVDFARGNVIKDLGKEQYGDRLIDSDNGGTECKTEVLEEVQTKAPAAPSAPAERPTELANTGANVIPMFATAILLSLSGWILLGLGRYARRHSYWYVA